MHGGRDRLKKGFRNTDLEGTGPADVLSGRDDKVKGQDMGMLSGNRAATLLNDAQTLDLNRTRLQHLSVGKLTCQAEGSTLVVYSSSPSSQTDHKHSCTPGVFYSPSKMRRDTWRVTLHRSTN